MSEDIYEAAAAADPDVMLPEGYTPEEDLFASAAESAQEESAADGLTTAEEAPSAPAPEPEAEAPGGRKLRFTARVDHEDRDVELSESELPVLYQKAQATERAQKRLKELRGGRDLGTEAEELLTVFPQMRGRSLPNEVVQESLRSGRSLTAAFAEYSEKQNRAALEELKRENAVLGQNRRAAERSPVRGVHGGSGTAAKAADPFLAGFNSDGW